LPAWRVGQRASGGLVGVGSRGGSISGCVDRLAMRVYVGVVHHGACRWCYLTGGEMSGAGFASVQADRQSSWTGLAAWRDALAAPRSWRVLCRRWYPLAVVVVAATSVLVSVGTHAVVGGPAMVRGLASLPVAARGPVSNALGRDDPSYGALTVAGGAVLRSPGQRLVARFGVDGVSVRSGRGRLGLRLVGYGYGGALAGVGEASPRAYANRVVYGHGGLREWWANGPLGLEQGFTLAARRMTRESC